MSTSVGTKARKKQSAKHGHPQSEINDPAYERALLMLESVCVRILESRFELTDEDTERMYWQQRFKNIVTPVSLALAESKGPRQFHFHYRHRSDDASVLQPVLEPAPEMLARTCRYALEQCQKKLAGIHDGDLIDHQRMLESALHTFLMRYEACKAK